MLRKQNGFTAVEGVLVVLLIVAIGAAGYFAYQVRTQSSDPTSQSQPKAKAAPKVELTTYSSKTMPGVSFQYPQNWKVEEKVAGDPGNEGDVPSAEKLTLSSPSGAVKLTWTSGLVGIGGACNDGSYPGDDLALCTLYEVINSHKLKNANLYSVSGVYTQVGDSPTAYLAIQASDGVIKTRRSFSGELVSGGEAGAYMLVVSPVAKSATKAEAEAALKSSDMVTGQAIIDSFTKK
ncbi:hypothetical protein EPO04_00365 [Patescibacteria group bacterium]|nr:MAG: hypothetical protein EPO04_00365 [Patescibacteria group bacterium]